MTNKPPVPELSYIPGASCTACFHDILKVLMHWWIRRLVLTSVVTPDLLSLLFLNAKLDSEDPTLQWFPSGFQMEWVDSIDFIWNSV